MTDPPAERSGGRMRGCLLTGCVVVLVLSFVPAVVLWALSRGAEEDAGPPRELSRQHVLPAGAGRIELDVRMTELIVEPAPAGSPLRLEARWHPSRFRLEEALEPSEGGWTYRLRLTGRGLRTWLPGSHGQVSGSELRLLLPADRPMSIAGEVGMGRSAFELGGLALQSVELELGAGEHALAFSSPTTLAVSRLALDSSMGELDLDLAGNASPRELSIHHGMGELRLDLGGRWRNDSRVDLRLGMGHTSVELPAREEAGALVEQGRVRMGSRRIEDMAESELVPGLPVVRIRAEGGMGELDIR